MSARHKYLTAEEIEEFEERAAIFEYEGGFSREEAEQKAHQYIYMKRWKRKNGI